MRRCGCSSCRALPVEVGGVALKTQAGTVGHRRAGATAEGPVVLPNLHAASETRKGLLCNRCLLDYVDASASHAYEACSLPLNVSSDAAALPAELSLTPYADDGFELPAYRPRAPRADVGAWVALDVPRHQEQKPDEQAGGKSGGQKRPASRFQTRTRVKVGQVRRAKPLAGRQT